MRMKLRTLLAGLLLTTSAHAEMDDGVRIEALLSHDRLAPGQSFRVAVVLDLAAPWHVNANPAAEGLVPTEVKWDGNITGITYSPGTQLKVEWADGPVSLYEGRVTILAEGRVRDDAPRGPLKLTGTLRYQACDNKVCLAPKTVPLVIETEVGDAGHAIHPDIFGLSALRGATDNQIEQTIRQRGWLFAFIIVFFGGLALNLTPCVYPMVAITVSYFGGREQSNKARAFAHAVLYFAGIVLTYSAIGLMAALTGGLFGALLQSRYVLFGIAALLVALALSMFGLFELQPPRFLLERATGLSSKAGYLGVFFLGAMVGVIAAPCVAPILVALLAFVGARGEAWLGWWMFFVLACGLGLPYVVLGTFSGLLARLPKSGTWMVWVKRVLGIALIAVALWLVEPVLGLKKKELIDWKPYSAATVAGAKGRPVLIDFWAEWCGPCRKMDRTTFRDARVVERTKQFVTIKADLTSESAPDVEAIRKQFGIWGVPTTVFLDAAGLEHAALRRTEFTSADEMLELMERAQSPAPTNVPGSASMPDVPPQLLNPF